MVRKGVFARGASCGGKPHPLFAYSPARDDDFVREPGTELAPCHLLPGLRRAQLVLRLTADVLPHGAVLVRALHDAVRAEAVVQYVAGAFPGLMVRDVQTYRELLSIAEY